MSKKSYFKFGNGISQDKAGTENANHFDTKWLSFNTTIIYFIIGCIWILFSDKLLEIIVSNKEMFAYISIIKGWFYVFASTLLIYVMVSSAIKKVTKLEGNIKERNKELEDEISERVRTEKELIKAIETAECANLAKSQFLANMSHEIRTPMNGIMGMTELMLMSSLDKNQKECMDMLKASTKNLLTIINDILDYSKIEAGKIQIESSPFNLSSVLKEIIALFEISLSQKGLQIDLQIDSNISDVVHGDAVRLRQVLSNLIGNAVKFTHKGNIAVSIKLENKNGNEIRLKFEVRDTGIGISKENQVGLFERFNQLDSTYSKNYQGTGLGLAISKKLVELMGGEIGVESEEGIGSTFYFTLPMIMEERKRIGTDLADEAFGLEKGFANHKPDKKILIAEDDEVNRFFITNLLMKYKYKLTLAGNGEEAVSSFKADKFDIILMDVQMPVLDGLSAAAAIREYEKQTGKHTPIIAMTAYAHEQDRKKFLDSGMDDYISKPINPNEMIYIIESWL